MKYRMLMCLSLLATFAAAQEAPVLETAMADSLRAARASAAAPRAQVVAVNKCWTRSPRVDEVMDSAKLPVDFCLSDVTVSIAGDGGRMIADGAYTPAGEAARVALPSDAKGMSSYKMYNGGSRYSAYIYEGKNAHGDEGFVFVSIDTDPSGKIVADSVRADFGVGCPGEECENGEEPGVRSAESDWKR